MSAECLLDTNVLVYAVDSDPTNVMKKQSALALLESADFGLSVQILQEFYVTVTRKIQVPLAPVRAMAYLDRFHAFPLIPTDFGLITEGIRNSVRFQLSYWDGAVIAAAERLHAITLYSEDFVHGRKYGDVTVVNPFLS
jgi:predicted nucleic acid-binding protein